VSCTNLPGFIVFLTSHTRETWWPGAKPQAASSKQQAASFKLRQSVIYASKMGMIIWSRAARELVSTIRYKPCEACIRGEAGGSSQTKGEKYERQDSKIRIPSGRSEARRGQEECRQVLTGTDPGDAAGTPRVPNYGPKIHRDRISGNSKSSRQRSSSRLCLELTQRALSGATPLTTNLPGLPSLRSSSTTRETWCRAPSHKQAQATRLKQQAASSSRLKLQAASFKHQAAQGASDKLQAPSSKAQASSRKQQAPGPGCRYIVSRQVSCHQVSSV
jgi:hypothetical protein